MAYCNCYQITLKECLQEIVIAGGFTPFTDYHVFITDKFDNVEHLEVTANYSGNLIITVADLPKGMFMSFSGSYSVQVFEEVVEGESCPVQPTGEPVVMEFCSGSYDCIELSFEANEDDTVSQTIPDCDAEQPEIDEPFIAPQPYENSFCPAVRRCFGISQSGDAQKFLNEQGQFVEVEPGISEETDPVFTNWLNTVAQVSNWNTAFAWGNHATAGYALNEDLNTEATTRGNADQLLQNQINDLINILSQLDAAVVLKGTWNASGGTFPGSGMAQAGWSYIVSVGGIVDGIEFTANDRIVAIADNASTISYLGNWHKLDYTDQVLSVNGQTGNVTGLENSANKTTTIAGNESSTTLYANVKGVVDWIKQGMTALLTSLSLTKATPVDADSLLLNDSEDSNKLKLLSWANLKATLKTYFDSLYLKHVIVDAWEGSSLSTSSTETIVRTITIPANTYSNGDVFSYQSILSGNTTGNITAARLRISTSASPADVTLETLLATYNGLGAAGGVTHYFERLASITSSGLNIFSPSTSFIGSGVITGGQVSAVSVDWTQTQYLFVTAARGQSGASYGIKSSLLQRFRV